MSNLAPLSRILDRICKEIGKNLLHQSMVTLDQRQTPNLPFNVPVRDVCVDVRSNLRNDFAERCRLQV